MEAAFAILFSLFQLLGCDGLTILMRSASRSNIVVQDELEGLRAAGNSLRKTAGEHICTKTEALEEAYRMAKKNGARRPRGIRARPARGSSSRLAFVHCGVRGIARTVCRSLLILSKVPRTTFDRYRTQSALQCLLHGRVLTYFNADVSVLGFRVGREPQARLQAEREPAT